MSRVRLYQYGSIPVSAVDIEDPPFPGAPLFEEHEGRVRCLSIPRKPVLGAYPALRRAVAFGLTLPEKQAIHVLLRNERTQLEAAIEREREAEARGAYRIGDLFA